MVLRTWMVIFGVLVCGPWSFPSVAAAAPDRVPVWLDTDIGSHPDDPFALALLLASPRVELRGVSTVGQSAEDRAWMVCRLLSHVGREDVAVAWGRGEQPQGAIDEQIQYRRHPAVVWNRTIKPSRKPGVELLHEHIMAEGADLTIIAAGPLTNVARLLERYPDCLPRIRRIVLMGGSIRAGYDGRPPAVTEWNIRADVAAARTVLNSGVPLTVVPLDATAGFSLSPQRLGELFAACTPLTFQVQTLFELAGEAAPELFDAVAVAAIERPDLVTFDTVRITVDDDGVTRVMEGRANARVATAARHDALAAWMVQCLAEHGERRLPDPPGHVVETVAPGGLPERVHVVENYETDIEKRWWLAGVVEAPTPARPSEVTAGAKPPGRVCRGMLTQDFDARQGDTAATYRAVVFNPVPGPPMGSRTRLSFRYKLEGTDALRVQIFSLSNGYHRYLSLRGLAEGKWDRAVVDMTAARRPDGSGGPLSKDERIDDIQFYVDPRAQLWIDDIVLYEAAGPGEQQPFPHRVIFTAWFDTGKQGREWPGDFEIVKHTAPRTWKAAKSVVHPETGRPWLRVHMRGRRAVGGRAALRFRYRLTGPGGLRVVVMDTAGEGRLEREIEAPANGRWSEADVRLAPGGSGDTDAGNASAATLRHADEIHFLLEPGAELRLDDVLLYEPGRREDN